jgi:hypothetical protein
VFERVADVVSGRAIDCVCRRFDVLANAANGIAGRRSEHEARDCERQNRFPDHDGFTLPKAALAVSASIRR